MSLILSILAGLLGSLFGSAARAGTAAARAQLEGEPMPEVLNISGSPGNKTCCHASSVPTTKVNSSPEGVMAKSCPERADQCSRAAFQM